MVEGRDLGERRGGWKGKKGGAENVGWGKGVGVGLGMRDVLKGVTK